MKGFLLGSALVASAVLISPDAHAQALNIKVDGNSYTVGCCNNYTPFATRIGTAFGLSVQNFGVSGQTTTQMLTDQSSEVLSTYQAGKFNILLVCEIGNDLATYGSVATAIANITTYCTNARNAGFYVILANLIHRGQSIGSHPEGPSLSEAQYNAKIDSVNAQLLVTKGGANATLRLDTASCFQTYTSGGYDDLGDKAHPNNTGQAELARQFGVEINYAITPKPLIIRGKKIRLQ